MKILLLGASGQLGREWQTFFARHKKEELYIIPYTSSQLDITRHDTLNHEIEAQRPDLIINCAAYTKVDKSEEERDKAMQINAEAVGNLAQLCEDHDIKLVHFSTDYIFSGQQKDRERFPGGYPEGHTADPVNWYGQTKWEGEQAVRGSGCRHLIMRVSWLCGAHGKNFVTAMLRLADTRKELNVVADQTGSPTFADNLVFNTFELIKQDHEGTYHLSSDGILSWSDFAKEIFELSGKDIKVNAIPSSEYPTEAERPFFSKLDTGKIKQTEGVATEFWKEGLKRLLKKLN